ncbi:MAG: hypothetical protein PSV36_04340 [Algoriphagus sp.]|nr:hypothetical protein [Algoriphagus sp.]
MKYLGVFFLMVLAFGCESVDSENPVVYPSDMQEVYKEMVSLSESETCSDSTQWLFTAYGSKACGGPIGYIAYSKKIDQDYFLGLVDRFTELQAEYNQKTGAVSDCALAIRPTGVSCENGKPKFIYS